MSAESHESPGPLFTRQGCRLVDGDGVEVPKLIIEGRPPYRVIAESYDPDLPPVSHLARPTDPATSHAGAMYAVESGAARKAQQAAYEAVRAHPGSTCSELEAAAGVRGRTFGRRLNELEAQHSIQRGPARPCTVTGRQAATWLVVESQP